MTAGRRVVVVGHGVAGLTAAQAARAQDSEALVTIIGAEPYDAYYRPRLAHDLRRVAVLRSALTGRKR